MIDLFFFGETGASITCIMHVMEAPTLHNACDGSEIMKSASVRIDVRCSALYILREHERSAKFSPSAPVNPEHAYIIIS